MALDSQKIADSIVSRRIISFADESEKILQIGTCTFAACPALTSVSLPAATSIGTSAFSGCSALTELIVGTDSDTVCTYDTHSSQYDPLNENLKIYVPNDLVDDYKAATNWSRLAGHIYGISERPE